MSLRKPNLNRNEEYFASLDFTKANKNSKIHASLKTPIKIFYNFAIMHCLLHVLGVVFDSEKRAKYKISQDVFDGFLGVAPFFRNRR